MSLIGSSIRFPVTVAVGVIIAVSGGLLALFNVPIQRKSGADQHTAAQSAVFVIYRHKDRESVSFF